MKPLETKTFSKEGLAIYANCCVRVRSSKSSCELCVSSCPAGAISLGKTLEIRDSCITCGACIAACPNGVFDSVWRDDEVLAAEVKEALGESSTRRLVFLCGQEDRREQGVIGLTCLSRLTESVLLNAFHLGAERVELRHFDCSTCSLSRSSFAFRRTLKAVKLLLLLLGIPQDHVQEAQRPGAPPYPRGILPQREKRQLTRRELFRLLKGEAGNPMQAFSGETSGKGPEQYRGANPKRGRLVRVLDGFTCRNAAVADDASLPFMDLEITNQCIGCSVCSNVCPNSALEQSVQDGDLTITFTAQFCTNCGLCQEVCIRKAIHPKDSFDLNEFLAGQKKKLIGLTEKACQACRQPFYGEGESICYFCLERDKPRKVKNWENNKP